MLTSDQACHAAVPVETYLKRCIFDTCACEQCENCLCTALAAYAHACSQKGIHIKWRTQRLCPLQCELENSKYASCTSPCPVETCDNYLQQSSNLICKTEKCFEGCQVEHCEQGFIYQHDNYEQCVPVAKCKPVCMVKNGKTYYEGDTTYQDGCTICRCTKQREYCTDCLESVVTSKPPNGDQVSEEYDEKWMWKRMANIHGRIHGTRI